MLKQNVVTTITTEFDCREKDISSDSGGLLPKIESNTLIGCVIDPDDTIEESNENNNTLIMIKNNNTLINIKFDCNN
ncbi:MAG: hypothetical protein WC422_01115 [Candidatus Paceibacterota bacterium]|jgi:subtilase family serine protease